MLKFLTSQKYRIKRQELVELQMVGEKFENFKHSDIRAYIRTLCRLRAQDQFREIFSIFHSLNQKKCPFQTLKILIFFHLMIQEAPQQCEDIVLPQINRIQKQISTNERELRERSKSGSIEKRLSKSVQKAVSWLKDKIPSSKEKQKKLKTERMQIHQTQEDVVLSKQLFIMMKIINPYFAYLIRSLSLLTFYQKCSKGFRIQIPQIWIIINVFKSFLQICQSFKQIFRYYKDQLYEIVIGVRNPITHEINFLYPILKHYIDKYLEELSLSYSKDHFQGQKKVEKLEQFIKCHHVKQLKNILDEITEINESMKFLFFAKYYPKQMKKTELVPKFIKTQSDQCDLLYHLIRLEKKQLLGRRATHEKRKTKTQPNQSSLIITHGNQMVGFKELRRRNHQNIHLRNPLRL